MPKKRHKAKEIINILQKVEILVSQGQAAQMVARNIGVSEETYYRWWKEYGAKHTTKPRN